MSRKHDEFTTSCSSTQRNLYVDMFSYMGMVEIDFIYLTPNFVTCYIFHFFYISIRKSFLSLNINNRKIWATVRKLFVSIHKNFIKLYNLDSLKVRSRKRLQFVQQKSQVKNSLKEMTCFKQEKVGPAGRHVKKFYAYYTG